MDRVKICTVFFATYTKHQISLSLLERLYFNNSNNYLHHLSLKYVKLCSLVNKQEENMEALPGTFMDLYQFRCLGASLMTTEEGSRSIGHTISTCSNCLSLMTNQIIDLAVWRLYWWRKDDVSIRSGTMDEQRRYIIICVLTSNLVPPLDDTTNNTPIKDN